MKFAKSAWRFVVQAILWLLTLGNFEYGKIAQVLDRDSDETRLLIYHAKNGWEFIAREQVKLDEKGTVYFKENSKWEKQPQILIVISARTAQNSTT